MHKKVAIVIICVILLILPIISLAATTAELNEKKNSLENKINQAEERQDEIKHEVSESKAELDKLNDEISLKEYEIEKVTAELKQLNSEVESLTKSLEEEQTKYDEQYELLCQRIVAQYKRGSVSYLDVLLNSNSLSDFISNYYIVEKIAEWDTQLLEQIEEQKNQIENSKKEVESKKAQVSEKQAQLKLDQSILINKKSNQNKYIAQLSAEDKELQKQIDALNAELKQTENSLAEIARQAASNANGHVYSGGKLEWPVPVYSRISSYFGYRGTAATGGVGTANHNGYDIAAPHHSNVVAAESGVVIRVINACSHDYPKNYKTKCNCGGGYGNYIMINHGGLVTLYGHVATGSIKVSVGDTVSRGQVIAGVGSCGWSTGYHLHFSVLLNGVYVNPGNYFGS